MDFNLKQWRFESEEEEETTTPAKSKFPKLVHHIPTSNSTLPLFLHQPHTTNYSSSHHHNQNNNSSTKFTGMMGSSFSQGQWQELELQALIYRHMIAGADVPHQLLAHLLQNTLITNSPFYPLHHCYPHYQPALVQSGYWGKGAMDPEPGRCRRTDGKKWRCSRDVVTGQKYCERHVHRGKNRSRKPVETPSPAAAADATTYGGDSFGAFNNNHSTNQFSLSGPSVDLLRLDSRPLNSIDETKCSSYEGPNDGQTGGNRTLRRFFDDWPRSLHEADNNASSSSVASPTNLSISMPENPSSDFSLKLGTGDGDESETHIASGQRDHRMNWGMGWEGNRVAPMGGPLAEALRSSMSTSSPKSVLLHQLTRSSASEASYVSS
ncbi:hypothetical protein CASFOL_027384 [Castilleja foliolosa]|uniref:Growth-regulating factor n=1 Tax=Castilleja foliolosa TaxID=1961234 RepID=A0ABD3CFG8_9LAMI